MFELIKVQNTQVLKTTLHAANLMTQMPTISASLTLSTEFASSKAQWQVIEASKRILRGLEDGYLEQRDLRYY
jgi:hypothetical protein